MPPSYTLYTPPGSFRAFAPLIAAEINHVEIIVETEDIERIAQEKSPTGQLPLLEIVKTTPSTTSSQGDVVIFSSAAIARYIAGLRTDTNLMGENSSFFERAAINQWVDWCGAELELPSCLLVYPIVGYMTITDPEITNKAKTDFVKALQILQDSLSETKKKHDPNDVYLRGLDCTLADIVIVSTLIYPFQMVCHRNYLVQEHSLDTVVEWFERCVQRPEFQAVLGKVEIGSKVPVPAPLTVQEVDSSSTSP